MMSDHRGFQNGRSRGTESGTIPRHHRQPYRGRSINSGNSDQHSYTGRGRGRGRSQHHFTDFQRRGRSSSRGHPNECNNRKFIKKRNWMVLLYRSDYDEREFDDFLIGIRYAYKKKVFSPATTTLGDEEIVRCKNLEEAELSLENAKIRLTADIPEFALIFLNRNCPNRNIIEETFKRTEVSFILVDNLNQSSISLVVDKIHQLLQNNDSLLLSNNAIESNPMGERTIFDLKANFKMSDTEVLHKLTADGSFFRRLNIEDKEPSPDLVLAILHLTDRACQCNISHQQRIMNEFLEKLASSVFLKTNMRNELDNMIDIMEESSWLDQRKQYFKEIILNTTSIVIEIHRSVPFKADEIKHTVSAIKRIFRTSIIPENALFFDAELKEKEKSLNAILENNKKKMEEPVVKSTRPKVPEVQQPPPNDFREMSIFPMEDEITSTQRPYLRKNIEEGRYESTDHYLDVQFRLLREDYIQPLREDIFEFLYEQQNAANKATTQPKTIADKRQKHQAKIYQGVKFSSSKNMMKLGQMCYMLKFDVSKLKHIRWDNSKKLLFGNLLCLSADNFKTVIFATVVDRKSEELKQGCLHVIVHVGTPSFVDEYRMADSPAYFEAYRHVLLALKSIRDEKDMPFPKYFVNCQTRIAHPRYLGNHSTFDVTCIVKAKQKLPANYRYTCKVLHKSTWPAKELLGLDESQFKALRFALSHELAIIQGPPGTGKTYIGAMIAQVLLENRHHWRAGADGDTPMLVVCYTNHALDQFLEAICEFLDQGIIRIGGRCKNKALEPFLLRNVKINEKIELSADLRFRLRKEYLEKARIESALLKWSKLFESLQKAPLTFNTLRGVVIDRDDLLSQIVSHSSDQTVTNDQSVNVWLVSLDPLPFKLDTLRRLMRETKKDQALCTNALLKSNGMFEQAKTSIQMNEMLRTNFSNSIPEAKCVPPLSLIDELQNLGYTEQDAIFALQQNNMNLNNASMYLSQDEKNEQTEKDESETFCDDVDEELTEFVEDSRLLDDDDGDELELYKLNCVGVGKYEHPVQSEWTGSVGGQNLKYGISKETFNKVLKAAPMSGAEYARVVNVWSLSLQQRWALYRRWLDTYRTKVNKILTAHHKFYFDLSERIREIRSLENQQIFRQAKVLGMTTSGAAKHQAILSAIKPRIVIIEEAAEVLESHVVTSLSRGCQHVILIGDHQQLRPSTAAYNLSKDYHLDISLFERLINNKFEHVMLQQQHRMRPEIANSLMPHFYNGLINHDSVYKFENIKGVGTSLFFFNHSYAEKRQDTSSYQNDFEANMMVGFCKYLLQQGYEALQVTILCCYAGQMFVVKELMKAKLSEEVNRRVRVTVVDNYQGEESEIILLSFVRSNSEKKIGFLNTKNRVCVALSRAKWGLFCFGNFNMYSAITTKEGVPIFWDSIIKSLRKPEYFGNALHLVCQRHKKQTLIQKYQDFEQSAPEGGCRELCKFRMDCGHACPKFCHPYDLEHKETKCIQPCERKCKQGHPCKKQCYEACGDCKVFVAKLLPLCGHKNKVHCYKPIESIKCQSKCEFKLSCCGHQCQEICDPIIHTSTCRAPVKKRLPCGHSMEAPCFQPAANVECTQLVDKTWPFCNHTNKAHCYIDVYKESCQAKCTRLLDCEHPCQGNCSDCFNGRLHVQCKEICRRILICGHECGERCTVSCPPCSKPCKNRCTHSKCEVKNGHGKVVEGRKCGVPCPTCIEKCQWRCQHYECTKLCWETCNRPRCTEKCRLTLKCGHNCIGVCGEKCPSVCAVCNHEQFATLREIFFGEENKDDACFIQLNDCVHIFEMGGLDQYFDKCFDDGDSKNGEIQLLSCPNCKKEVLTSQRYGNVLKKKQLDVQKVKVKLSGDLADINKEQEKLVLEIKNRETDLYVNDDCRKLYAKMGKFLDKQQFDFTTNDKLVRSENFFTFIVEIEKIYKSIERIFVCLKEDRDMPNALNYYSVSAPPSKSKGQLTRINPTMAEFMKKWMPSALLANGLLSYSKLQEILIVDVKLLIVWIESSFGNASAQMMSEFSNELRRTKIYADVIDALILFFQRGLQISDFSMYCASTSLHSIMKSLYGSKTIDPSLEKQIIEQLNNVQRIFCLNTQLRITENERKEILKAMDMRQGHWFKCKNDHIYCITECGGATETAKCPECGEQIGGSNHQLLSDNSLAGEMDGASSSAWREANRGLADALQNLR